MTTRVRSVAPSEGDTNLTDRRAAWQARSLDAAARALLARDSKAFLHQSVSTPCLNAIAKAEGIWIEDTAGRRYIESPENGWRYFLFVRENKDAAYCAIGPATKVDIEGDRPMSLHWKLEVAMPMELFRAFSVLRA